MAEGFEGVGTGCWGGGEVRRLLDAFIHSVFMSGVVFTCCLNVYSFLTISGGMGATLKLNVTIAFVLAYALPVGCVLRGCMLGRNTLR